MMQRPDPDELQRWLLDTLPAIDRHGLEVEDIDPEGVRLRFPFDRKFIGPGDIFSGPALLGFTDTAIYAAAKAVVGRDAVPLVSTLSVTFLRPAQAADILALARVISRRSRVLHTEAWLFAHAVVDPLLHATATCVVR